MSFVEKVTVESNLIAPKALSDKLTVFSVVFLLKNLVVKYVTPALHVCNLFSESIKA